MFGTVLLLGAATAVDQIGKKKYFIDLNGDGIQDMVKVSRIFHTKSYYLGQEGGNYLEIESLSIKQLEEQKEAFGKKFEQYPK